MPTDTVYGLVALATDKDAVARLYQLKHREHKPGTLIAASADQLIALGLEEQTVRAVAHFWPNPLSVVIRDLPTLDYLDQGLGGLAVRVPLPQGLRGLLQATGPLLTSSANEPGQPTASNIQEAQAYFGDSVDFYVDGGDLSGHPPSTVARFEDGRLEVLRQGAFVF